MNPSESLRQPRGVDLAKFPGMKREMKTLHIQPHLKEREPEHDLQLPIGAFLRAALWYFTALQLCTPSAAITSLACSLWPPSSSCPSKFCTDVLSNACAHYIDKHRLHAQFPVISLILTPCRVPLCVFGVLFLLIGSRLHPCIS